MNINYKENDEVQVIKGSFYIDKIGKIDRIIQLHEGIKERFVVCITFNDRYNSIPFSFDEIKHTDKQKFNNNFENLLND